ncbi:unnamed protein product [Effrenium voratum]|nr:unnamed protein product [Effrenium voratum]
MSRSQKMPEQKEANPLFRTSSLNTSWGRSSGKVPLDRFEPSSTDKISRQVEGAICPDLPALGTKELAVKIVDVRERDEHGGHTDGSGSVDKGRVPAESCGMLADFYGFFLDALQLVILTPDRPMNLKPGGAMCLGRNRTLRPDNFLWGGPDNKTLKLCDYGCKLSSRFDRGLAVMMPKTGRLSGVFGRLLSFGAGAANDPRCFGCSVAYLLVFGSFPYSPAEASAPAMKKAIIEDSPPLKFPSLSEAQGVVAGSLGGALDFTKMLLKRASKERPTAAEALKHEFVAEKVADQNAENELMVRKNVSKAKKVTQQIQLMRPKRDSTVQHGIDDLLKKLITKFGGDMSGSNIFFSEGDEKLTTEEEDTPNCEPRVKRRSSRRDVKHSTHSGIIDQSGGFKFDNMSPVSSMTGARTGKSLPGDVHGISNKI